MSERFSARPSVLARRVRKPRLVEYPNMNVASLLRSPTAPTKPILLVPSIQDIRRTAQPDVEARVERQLKECAKLLASYNFWRRDRRGLRPGIERWDAINQRPPTFVGLDLSTFIATLEAIFEIRTDSDGPCPMLPDPPTPVAIRSEKAKPAAPQPAEVQAVNGRKPAQPVPRPRCARKPRAAIPKSEPDLAELEPELGEGYSLVEDEPATPETHNNQPTKFTVVSTSSGWFGLRIHDRDYLVSKDRREFYAWLNTYTGDADMYDFTLTFNSPSRAHRPDRSTL